MSHRPPRNPCKMAVWKLSSLYGPAVVRWCRLSDGNLLFWGGGLVLGRTLFTSLTLKSLFFFWHGLYSEVWFCCVEVSCSVLRPGLREVKCKPP